MVNNNDITNTGDKDIISDTALHYGDWKSILILVGATFTTLEDKELNSGTWDGRAFTVGTFLTGTFTQIQLSAGEVIAYA